MNVHQEFRYYTSQVITLAAILFGAMALCWLWSEFGSIGNALKGFTL